MQEKIKFVSVKTNERIDELLKLPEGTVGIFCFEADDKIGDFQDWMINHIKNKLEILHAVIIINKDYTKEKAIQKMSKTILKRTLEFRPSLELDIVYLSDESFKEILNYK